MPFQNCIRNFVFCAVTAAAVGLCGQSAEELAMMEAAIAPLKAETPASPRKVLIFSQTLGFRHASIPHGHAALKMMGEKTGAYTSDSSEDPAVLKPGNLKQYDAIIFLNTTGDLVTTKTVQEGFLRFISEGKGFVSIHAATDCCYDWHPYGDMLGGYFNGHPWNSDSKVTLKIDDPKHPINRAFRGKPFEVTDEIYQFKEPYSRKRQRILTSLDPEKTDMKKPGTLRADGDYGVSWVKKYGKGRVFNCSLGHNPEIYWNPTVLGHYLAGIQFALGDLKADAEPIPLDEKTYLDRVLKGTVALSAEFNYGMNDSYFHTLDEVLRGLSSKDSAKISKALTDAVLTSTTISGRMELMRRLTRLATSADAIRLLPLLDDESEDLAEHALMVLQETEGEAVSRLLAAEAETSRALQVGVVQTFAARNFAAAVPELSRLANHDDAAISKAAISGLGRVGDIAAKDALWKLLNSTTDASKREGALAALVQWSDAQTNDNARQTYEAILAEAPPESASRLAALNGLLNRSADPLPTVTKYLTEEQGDARQVVEGFLVQTKSEKIGDYVLTQVENATGEEQANWLKIATTRGDKRVLKYLMTMLEDGQSSESQATALGAMAAVGDASVVPRLIELSATGAMAEQAREILDGMNASGTDEALMKIAEEEKRELAARTQALRALARRKSADQLEAALALAEKADPLQGEAFKTVAALATAESYTTVAALHQKQTQPLIIKESEKAVVAAARLIESPEAEVESIGKMLAAQNSPTDKEATWVNILAGIEHTSVPAILRDQYKGDNKEVRVAVVRGLADYPRPEALEPLMELLRVMESDREKSLALRGAARLLTLPADRSGEETLAIVDAILSASKSSDDLRAVIGNLGEIAEPQLLPRLKNYFSNNDVKSEAQLAALQLIGKVYPFIADQAKATIDEIAADSEAALEPRIAEAREKLAAASKGLAAWRIVGPFTASSKIKEQAVEQFPPDGIEELTGGKLVLTGDMPRAKSGVDMAKVFGRKLLNSVAYAEAVITSDEARETTLTLGTDDGAVVFLNGIEILSVLELRPFTEGENSVALPLKAGKNVLRMKLLQIGGGWEFGAKVIDGTGETPEGVVFSVGGL